MIFATYFSSYKTPQNNISNHSFIMTQESTKININANNELVSVNEQLPPLGDTDVRIQIVTSNINKNDLSMWESKNNCDFFGTEIVGKVTAVGKNVGHCKVGQTVGVHREKNNFK